VAVSLGSPAQASSSSGSASSSSSSASSQGSANSDPRASDLRLQTLEKDVSQTPGVAAVTPVQIDKAGTTAYFSAIARTGPAEQATANLVSKLRSNVIPDAEKGTNMRAYVGGSTAANVDRWPHARVPRLGLRLARRTRRGSPSLWVADGSPANSGSG
jgi:putative drug exporter of the RND superfamily